MDFIERWFHVSPDGGDGSLEALFIVAIVAVIVLAVFRRRVWSAVSSVAVRLSRRGD